MNNWFETKVRYERLDESGAMKFVTESYLVDALSHAEAENRIIKEISYYTGGSLDVAGVKKVKISEIFGLESDFCDLWYKAKVAFISIDEKTGMEKRTNTTMYVHSADIDTALRDLREGMKGTIADYEVVSIAESPVIEVYPYSESGGDGAFYDGDDNPEDED